MTDEIQGAGNVTDRGLRAKQVLSDLMERSSIEVEIALTETDERIKLDVYPAQEDDAALLIGRQGRTLSAYQFILNRIVNRFPEDRKPVSIDVSGYAEQRKARLATLAGRLANSVRDQGVEIQILGMDPADRRAVHMALAEEDRINTFSEDEGIGRRLVVTLGRS